MTKPHFDDAVLITVFEAIFVLTSFIQIHCTCPQTTIILSFHKIANRCASDVIVQEGWPARQTLGATFYEAT
jgi:hypothetical protein